MEQCRGTLPTDDDKGKTSCHPARTHTRPALRAAAASTEHELRADGQSLASSSSYRSLLAPLLLLCSQLIATDKGCTGLCRHHRTERVVLSGAGLGQREQVRRGVEAEGAFRQHPHPISASCAASPLRPLHESPSSAGRGA